LKGRQSFGKAHNLKIVNLWKAKDHKNKNGFSSKQRRQKTPAVVKFGRGNYFP
jgi:hypothetical protein